MDRIEKLNAWNQKLGAKLKQFGISKLWMTSYGNSIASGFSMVTPVVPLLYRNITLERNMLECGIELKRYAFARAQNNNEDHLLHWLIDNISEIEIHKMNRVDYGETGASMLKEPLSKAILDTYFPLDLENPARLQDVVTSTSEALANIVIYNGATGSLLDNFTRKGKHKNLNGVKRDIKGLDAILRIIQDFNRNRGCNTQVYLCGVPNILGINASEIINMRLKSLAKEYANVVYVKPVKQQFVYFKNGIKVDVHYSDLEYEEMHIGLMKQIYEAYFSCKTKIEIDRMLYHQSKMVEYGSSSSFEILLENSLKQTEKSGIDLKAFQNDLSSYVLERYPYDYFYLPKKKLVKIMKRGL